MLTRLRLYLRQLGPGLITGAADDDPSGIATYSQAGAQFGFSMLWRMVFALPLMAAIQIISARIGYVMQVFLPYQSYVRWLKWLTLALLAYVGVIVVIGLDWREVAARTLHPDLHWNRDTLPMLVALFGTTISPNLFFWQASQEVEDHGAGEPHTPQEVRQHLRRIKIDTNIGMTFSNLIALFIMPSTAATLHAHGVTDIQTSAQAVEATRPLAGEHAALLFALGIIGTGMLAVPVLAGSAAYAVAEMAGWRGSLQLRLERGEGRGFYGVVAVPIMMAMMVLASRPSVMQGHAIGPRLRVTGWLATGVMALTVLALALA